MSSSNVFEKKARTGWLLSYGDVITLLITFFIMMISKQAGDISKINRWVNDRLGDANKQIEEVIQKKQLINLSTALHSKGVQITLRGQSIFESGDDEPMPELREQLVQISTAIRNLEILNLIETKHISFIRNLEASNLDWNVEIRIEGHTDNIPLMSKSKFKDNWELSAARAQTIMKILQKNTGLNEKKFAVAGFGEFKPVADNNSIEGRSLNRRVEIYIDASIEKRQ
ncbi:MAG: flagellar motor protein MotB [Candidatus Marinimicrobia bacterium]|nr:flagellar motor protein MotB [Candidatus Neomarinimicrobiota bacterium]